MGVRIKTLLSSLALSTTATFVSIAATAQEQPTQTFKPRETIPNEVDRSFYGSTGEFSDRNPVRAVEVLVGTPGFPENLISRDAERVHRLYRDLLNQQVSNDPLIRTADLPNPYGVSVLTLPNSNDRVTGSEFTIDQPLQSQSPAPVEQLPQRF